MSLKLPTVVAMLEDWKRQNKELDQMLNEVNSNEAFAVWEDMVKAHNEKLRWAFWKDTEHINSWSHCKDASTSWIVEMAEKAQKEDANG